MKDKYENMYPIWDSCIKYHNDQIVIYNGEKCITSDTVSMPPEPILTKYNRMINNITIKTWFSTRIITAFLDSLIVKEEYANWIYKDSKITKFLTEEKLIEYMGQVQKKYNLF